MKFFSKKSFLLFNVILLLGLIFQAVGAASLMDSNTSGVSSSVSEFVALGQQNEKGGLKSIFAKPAYTPTGEVSLSSPDHVFLGEIFTLNMTFNNNGTNSDHGSTGYGPFIDLYVPRSTIDGGGISPAAGGDSFVAQHGGENLVLHVTEFASTSDGICLTHPIGLDIEGKFLKVCDPNAEVGDQIVTIELPYGSYTPDQAVINVSMDLKMDDDASIDTILSLRARGGYKYGATPEVDWCCTTPKDTTIISDTSPPTSWVVNNPVTPQVIELTKENSDTHTPSGPNYPQSYEINLHTADGAVFRDVMLTDSLPPNIVYMGGMTVTDQDGSTVLSPVITFDSDGPSGLDAPISGMPAVGSGPFDGATIVFDFTGSDLPNGVMVTFDYYVPATVAGSGASTYDSSYENIVRLDNATWVIVDNPIDPDVTRDFSDPGVGPGIADTKGEILTFGKSSTTTGGVPIGPNAQVRYQVTFRLSDYFGIEDIVISDTLPDGLHFDSSIEPTLTIHTDGATPISGMNIANYSVTCDYNGAVIGSECDAVESNPSSNTGETELSFDISAALTNALGNGQLHGGEVQDGLSSPAGSTTGTITYYGLVQDKYMRTGYTEFVKMGDDLKNVANFEANLLDVENCDTTTNLCPSSGSVLGGGSPLEADDTNSLPQGSLTKDIVALNGVACDTSGNLNACSMQNVMAGDWVTYRITQEIPTGDFSGLTIKDYLPLPIFLAENPANLGSTPAPSSIWLQSSVSAPDGIPGVGEWKYGPAHTYSPINNTLSPLPTVSFDPSIDNNYLQFFFGSDDDPANNPVKIDLLFSIEVTDRNYGDGLTLRNHVEASDSNSPGETNSAQNNVDLILNEPKLEPSKSVVSVSGSGSAQLVPNPTDYGFNLPGTTGRPWSLPTVINSDYFDSHGSPDSSATGLDGGDLLRYAIVIENTGNSPDGAFDIQINDILPPQLQVPSGGLNLQIWLGDGTTQFTLDNSATPANETYSYVDGSATSDEDAFFGAGIEINDPSTGLAYGEGACQGHDATNGKNIIVVTYDLQLKPDLESGTEIVNKGGVKNYSSKEGGDNYSPGDDHDDSSVIVGDLSIEKTLVSSEYNDGSDNQLAEATIGEIVRYHVEVTLPEATTRNVRIVDTLDDGLHFLNVVSGSFALEDSNGASLTGVLVDDTTNADLTLPTAAVSGNRITWNFGTVKNTSDNDPTTEKIIFDYEVMVLDSESSPAIHKGVELENNATVRWDVLNLDTDDPTDYKTVRDNVTNTPSVLVVEPEIDIVKSVTPTTTIQAGDTIQYTITLQHLIDGNNTDAYDLTFSDPLPKCANGASFITIDESSAATIENAYSVSDTDATSPVVKGTDFELVGTNASGWTLQTPSGHSFDVPYSDPSRVITLTVTGVVSSCVNPGVAYENVATVDWSSMDGEIVDRDTNGTGNDQERDYSDSNSVNSAVFDVTEPVLTKSVYSTSDAESPDGELALGEVVTYQLAFTLPQGTATDVTVEDVIPAGLEYVADSATLSINSDVDMTIDADLTGANGIDLTSPGLSVPDITDVNGTPFVSTTGSVDTGQVVTVTLGDIYNGDEPASGATTAEETVIVRFNAVVLDTHTSNTIGTVKENDFEVSVSGNTYDSNDISSTIIEPDLDIEKTNALVSSNCVDLNDASGTSYNNCIGATIGYTLKISNPYYEADGTTRTYSSVAWDSVISDEIPTGLTLNPISLRAERVDTSSGSEVRTSVGSVGSGWILDYTAPTITLTAEAGQRFDVNDDVWYEIIYQAVIDQNASAIGVTPAVDNVPLPGDVLTNTAKVDWTNKDGVVPDEKTYSESTDSSVTVENGELVVDKYDATFEITGTNSTLEPNAKIYYGIRFQNTGNVPTKFSLSEDLPANTTYDAALTDTTNGVTGSWTLNTTTGEYEAVPVTVAGAGLLAEAGATDAGTGDPTDRGVWYFVVTIDDPLPAGVHEINNVATVYMDENSGGPEPKPGDNKDTSDLEAVGEPSLSITKTNNKDTTTLGDTLVYTITYRNTGGQNATGVVLTETVPAGTTWFNDPSVTTDDGWVCDAVGAAGETCEWTIGALAAHPTDVHTVTFAVKVDDVTSVDFVDNTVTVEDDGNNNTTPGSPPQSATDTDQDILIQGMEKHLLSISEPAATTFNPTGNDAAIGSILVYEVTIDIPSTPGSDDIIVPNFVLTDVLDQGLAFLGCGDGSGADAVTADANLTTSAGAFVDLCDKATAAQPTTTTGNSPTVGEYPIGSGETLNQGRMLTFDFGTLTNDNSSSTTQTITIVYRAVVLNDASVVVGSGERNNQVNADWDDVTTPMTDEAESVEIVEPFLDIQKTASGNIVPIGGGVQYKLTIFHESSSTTSAYDVNVFDTLPLELEYVVGSETHVSGEVPDSMTFDPATRTLTIAYDDWDPTVNQDSVITFEATVNFYSSGSIVNQANVEWTSLPGDFETVEQSPFNSLSNERYYDPLDDVDVYGASSSVSIQPPFMLPETGFARDKITIVPNQPDNLQYSKTDNLVLEIPALNVKSKIVGIPEYQNTWDATWLQDDIGYLTGTAFPTQAGRTLLAGHVVDAQGAPSVFAELKNLHWGDEFVIYANGLKYVYQVQSNERIKADNMDIYNSSAYDEVSLITCQGYNEATGEYDWRIAVTGVLIRLEK